MRKKDFNKEKLIETVSDSGLRGLGGAGFPAGKKWSFVRSSKIRRSIIWFRKCGWSN